MTIKNNLQRIFLVFLLLWTGFIVSMEPALRPIDQVFLNACKNDKPIEFSIKNGADIDVVDPVNGYTGLHYACRNGNLDRVKFLMNNNCDFRALTKEGKNAISTAKDAGHNDIAQFLSDRMLIVLCQLKNLPFESFRELIIPLLKSGANINAVSDIRSVEPMRQGLSPLHYVCALGDANKVQLLLSNGAEINRISEGGMTPLYATFGFEAKDVNSSQSFEIARLLIDRGADVWIDGPSDQSILQVAAITGNIDAVELIINTMNGDKEKNWREIDNKGYDALVEAIIINKNDIVLALTNAGVSIKPKKKDKDGMSPMHWAAAYDNKTAIEELVKRGLDINISNDDGQTALHLASQEGKVDLVKTLLALEADPRIRDKNGKIALDLSTNKEVRKILSKAKQPKKKISAQAIGVSVVPEKTAQANVQEKSLSKKAKGKAKGKAKQELLVSQKAIPVESVVEEKVLEHEESFEQQIPTSPREIKKASRKVTEKSKPSSFAGYVQKKVTQAQKKATDVVQDLMPTQVTPATVARTYANVVGGQDTAQEPEEKMATVVDDYMTIMVAIPPHMVNTLSLMKQQDNPLVGIKNYSKHVEEKRNNLQDMFHNFSARVEERLGFFAQPTVIKDATKKHSATIKYVIPAYVKIFSDKPIYGKFEFVVRDGIMQHRFFKPDQKKREKGEKISFTLPTSGNDNNKGLSLKD